MRPDRLRSLTFLGCLLVLASATPSQAIGIELPITPFPAGGSYSGETIRFPAREADAVDGFHVLNGFFDIFIELPELHRAVPSPAIDSFFDVFVDVELTGTMCGGPLPCPGSPLSNTRGQSHVQGTEQAANPDTFDTEMLMLDLRGDSALGPFMLRESPSRPSLGQTRRLNGLPPGEPYIGSFFDIFTELSIDGGQTGIESFGSSRFTLRGGGHGARARGSRAGNVAAHGHGRRRAGAPPDESPREHGVGVATRSTCDRPDRHDSHEGRAPISWLSCLSG